MERLAKTINALFPLRTIHRDVQELKEALKPNLPSGTSQLTLDTINSGDIIKIKKGQHEYDSTPYIVKKKTSNFGYTFQLFFAFTVPWISDFPSAYFDMSN